MAWTAPRTWVIGETITAAFLNTQLRDNLLETMTAKATAAGDLFQGTAANALARIARSATVGHVFQVLTSTTIGWGAAPSTNNFPAGVILFFDGAACPSGWAEVTGARGRFLVGLVSGGTLAGTVGSALTNLGSRTIAEVISHSHDAGGYTMVAATHTHTLTGGTAGSGYGPSSVDKGGATPDGAGSTSSAGGGHTDHAVGGATSSSGAATVDVTMPYIQYIVCKKS